MIQPDNDEPHDRQSDGEDISPGTPIELFDHFPQFVDLRWGCDQRMGMGNLLAADVFHEGVSGRTRERAVGQESWEDSPADWPQRWPNNSERFRTDERPTSPWSRLAASSRSDAL